MAFEFFKYMHGGEGDLFVEKRLAGISGYAMYVGQALKISGGGLIYAQTGDIVYAISKVSAASSTVTASYYPEVNPVNTNQIWKASIGTAVTAATSVILGYKFNFNDATAIGTAIDGNNSAGTSMWLYNITTGSSPSTSAAYVIFAPQI